MQALASSSTLGLFPSATHALDYGYSYSYSTNDDIRMSTQYDHRGRLQPFVESPAQHRARRAFLRKRGLSKRISAWLSEASSHSGESSSGYDEVRSLSSVITSVTNSDTMDVQDNDNDSMNTTERPSSSRHSSSSSVSTSSALSLRTIDEEDESASENDVIYATPSFLTRHTPTQYAHARTGSFGATRSASSSSLSSIEEGEEH